MKKDVPLLSTILKTKKYVRKKRLASHISDEHLRETLRPGLIAHFPVRKNVLDADLGNEH